MNAKQYNFISVLLLLTSVCYQCSFTEKVFIMTKKDILTNYLRLHNSNDIYKISAIRGVGSQ